MRDLRPGKASPSVRHGVRKGASVIGAEVRTRGAQHQRNLRLIREYEANPNPKSQPLGHGIARKIGTEALDLTTGIPSLLHQIHSMRSHRGDVAAEVQPGNVLPLIGGMRASRRLEELRAPERSHMLAEPSEASDWAKAEWAKHLAAGKKGMPKVGTWKDVAKGAAASFSLSKGIGLGIIFGSAGLAKYGLERPPGSGIRPHDPERWIKTEGAIRGGFRKDVAYLLRTKQIDSAHAQQANEWATFASGEEIGAERTRIRSKYRLPKLK
jgi:hypothetical protein